MIVRENLDFLSANKSIRLERSIRQRAIRQTALCQAPAMVRISLWHEDVRAKNGITNTTFRELYRYSSRVEDESRSI